MSVTRHISDDAQGAADSCAAFIAAALRQELAASPVATLAVSGGSTPRLMFDALRLSRWTGPASTSFSSMNDPCRRAIPQATSPCARPTC